MSVRAPSLRTAAVIAVLATATVAPSAARAEAPVRHGLLLGGGLFGGNISCDGASCSGFRSAGGGSLHVGYMFTPRLGVLVDAWAMTSSKDDVSITFVTTTIDVRYWLASAIWLQGGLGNGHAQVSIGSFDATGDNVPVVELGAGFEVVRGRHWALDVSAKIAQGSSADSNTDASTGRSTGLGAHFTWYASP